MKPTLLVYILGFLLILAMGGFIMQSCENRKLERENGDSKRLLIRGQRRTEKQIDSMAVEYRKIEALSQVLMFEVEKSREELKKQHLVTTQWKVKYEKAKNTPAPEWDFVKLDSIMESIITR